MDKHTVFFFCQQQQQNRNILVRIIKLEPNENGQWKRQQQQNLLFNSKHDHVLFILAVKHCDDDKDYNMLNNNGVSAPLPLWI